MNNLTLNFIDSTYEATFRKEYFEIEEYLLQRMYKLIIVLGIALGGEYFVYQNYPTGCVVLALTAISYPLFRLSLRKLLYMDIFIVCVQIILVSLYPILMYQEMQFGSDKSMIDIPKQYQRATAVQFASFSVLICSKYYIKAFVIIYNIVLQMILYYIDDGLRYKGGVLIAITGIAAIYSCYHHELSLRCYFIRKQQMKILSNNVMTSFNVPFVWCSIKNDILTLFNNNQSSTDQLKITDQSSFTKFIRSFKIYPSKLTLEQYGYTMFGKDNSLKEQVIRVTGYVNGVRYLCYMSTYFTQQKEMLFMNFQNILTENLEQELRLRITKMEQKLEQTFGLIKQFAEVPLDNDYGMLVYQCQKFLVGFYGLYIEQLSKEPITQINLRKVIMKSGIQITEKDIEWELLFDQECNTISSMKYHLYVLISTLIQNTNKNAIPHSKAIFEVKQVFDEWIRSPLIHIDIYYTGPEYTKQQQQLLNSIANYIGSRIKSLNKEHQSNHYRLALVQNVVNIQN